MVSPQRRIMEALQNDVETKFALVVNDSPVVRKRCQVYIQLQQSKLVTTIYPRGRKSIESREEIVDLSDDWAELLHATADYGVDFSAYYAAPGVEFKVTLNRAFGIIFVESPIVSLMKLCIKSTDGRPIGSVSVSGMPLEVWEKLQERWPDAQSDFTIRSVGKYCSIMKYVMQRKLDRKMSWERNRLFSSMIVPGQTNFLYLFSRIDSLYNPFLDNHQLSARVKSSWFYNMKDNTRMFARSGVGYTLYVMTVSDFCKSIGLDTKLGFTSEAALHMLFSLMYTGAYNSLAVASARMKGFLVETKDLFTGKTIGDPFFIENRAELAVESEEQDVIPITGLDRFVYLYHSVLSGDSGMSFAEVKRILSGAVIEGRRE